MFLYLTKTFVAETLYYCNLLCYVKCSTSLLIFEAIAMSLYHITPTHAKLHTQTHTYTHTLDTHRAVHPYNTLVLSLNISMRCQLKYSTSLVG